MVIAEILLENSGFLLHASSMVHDGRGYIFTGQEGAGKSTISRLFPKSSLRGDDVAIIRKIHNTVYLFGSPFYQKTKRAYPNTKTPIAGIFTLTHARFHLVQMVPIEKKLFILINNALIGKNTKKQRDLLFKNILNILKYIKIFNICFFPHKDVCLLIFKSADMLKQEVDSHVISHNLNVTVLNILPKNITWLNAITTISQLPIFYILNDPTWNFELNSNRLIRNAAALFNDGTSGSRHKEKVVKLLHKPVRTLTKKTFICLNFQNTITVIDGNHAAVALAISANTLRISQHTLIYLIVGYSDNLNSFPFVN